MPISIRKLKRWLKPFERTLLHPQWLLSCHGVSPGNWIKEHAYGKVVDVGCGNGWVREQVSDALCYVGLDYPATMALGYFGRPDILADAARLPIASASVDTVLLLDILEHLPEPGQAVAEASRILRSGGKCQVSIPFLYPLHDEPHDYQRFTIHGLRHILEKHGFRILQIKEGPSPCATAAALLSMALSKGVLDAIQRKSPAVIAAILILALVPAVNVFGWLASRVLPKSGVMPGSYRVVATPVERINPSA